MRLTNRKLGVLAAVALAAISMVRYAADRADPPPYAPGTVQCRAVDANGLPTGCVPIDPAHFGFAALRGM